MKLPAGTELKSSCNNTENLYLEIIGKHVNNYEIPPTPF